ncbi:MAG TPA: hypothetical protein PLI13_13630, partial [Paracoccus sp. (in: a-proteobacteria)]|nr:hypothetical protein [Paracoccus sp. (in: a-proteobacteria)]
MAGLLLVGIILSQRNEITSIKFHLLSFRWRIFHQNGLWPCGGQWISKRVMDRIGQDIRALRKARGMTIADC